MKYLSVCSGIEAATVAWRPLGWTAAAFAEIEDFPSAVLAHHYPETSNLGDFTQIEVEPGAFDVLVGGTPCQSFSVAGLRGGLGDDRGNLALEFLRLADRARSRWVVWENVPGVLSSLSHDAPDQRPPRVDLDGDDGPGDGEEVVVVDEYDADEANAFSCFLAGLSELGYGWAYRVLDAQHFGVPQRRRRVFVVGYLGDWRRAAAVLLERHCLSGHPAPRRETGPDVAGTLASRAGAGGGFGTDFDCSVGVVGAYGGNNSSGAIDVATACNAHGGPHGRLDFESETFIAHTERVTPPLTRSQYGDHESREGLLVAYTLRADGFDAGEDETGRGTPLVAVDFRNMSTGGVSQTLQVGGHGTSPNNTPHVIHPQPFIVNAAESCATRSHARESETARCLDGTGSFANAQGGTVVMQPIPFDTTQITSDKNYSTPRAGDPCHPLAVGQHPPAIAFQERGREGGQRLDYQEDVAYSLMSPSGGGRRQEMNVAARSRVRRLTPRECERLMGFPDGYTDVPFRGRPAADGNRYKALGNSMAVPCMAWIGRRIAMVEALVVDEHVGSI